MAHQRSLALDIARGFGDLELEPTGGEAVFFTIPGWVVVRYGSDLALGSAVLAVVVAGWVVLQRIRRGPSSIGRLGAGIGLALLGALVAVAVTTLLWIGITALRGGMGMLESYAWLAVLAACLGACWYLIWRSMASGSDLVGGVVLLWGVLALLTGVWLPSMSYLFVWPTIAAGLAIVAQPQFEGRRSRLVGLAIVTLPTAILLTPAVDTFFQLATPRPGNPESELPAVIAGALLLVILAVGLVNVATSREWPAPPTTK